MARATATPKYAWKWIVQKHTEKKTEKWRNYAKPVRILGLVVLLSSSLWMVSLLSNDPLMQNCSSVLGFRFPCGSAQAEAMNEIHIEDSVNELCQPYFTVYEANGKLGYFTNSDHLFYVTNDNDFPVSITDIYFHVDTYSPLSDYFLLDTQEAWGDPYFEDAYTVEIPNPLQENCHGVKLSSIDESSPITMTQIDAHGARAVYLAYDAQEAGVYEGELYFTYEMNGQVFEQAVVSDPNKPTSAARIVSIPDYDYDYDTNRSKYFTFDVPLDEMLSDTEEFKPLDATFSCIQDVRQHLLQYYADPDAYYQCILDNFIPFINSKFNP